MRAVDTNVVVRYLTGDDARQAARARALIDGVATFIPRTVMLEAEWVLRSLYELPAGRVVAALRALAGLPTVTVEDAALVARALRWADSGADFANALHLASAAGCDGLATFDKRFAKSAARLGGVPVVHP